MTGLAGEALRTRLAQLGLSVATLARGGFTSRATINRVLAGQDSIKSPAVAAGLEYSVGWRTGSLRAIVAGGSPEAIEVMTWPRMDGDWNAAITTAWASDAQRQ